MKDIANIIKGLVNGIDNTILGSLDALTGHINTCHTKWVRVGKIVKNSAGNEYAVTSMVTDEYITALPLLPSSPPLNGIITIPIPYWITGTHIATNNEWTKANKILLNKTPIAWLLETLRMQKYGLADTRDFESEVRIFFLDETDVVNYYTADHREQVVVKMEELAKSFIDSVTFNRTFKTLDEYELLTFSRFGVERNDGMFQNILDANLSGVELRVTLTKYKENCKC